MHYLHFYFQTARVCEEKPPLEYNLMDVIWPRKDTKLGSKITYSCPFRTGTTTKQLKGTYRLTLERAVPENNLLSEQYVQCIWDKDTDEMVWWPPAIEDCTSKYYKEMLSAFTKLLFPLSKYNAGTSHILKVSLHVR